MGRLIPDGLRRIVAGWILPVLLSGAVLFGFHSQVRADPVPSRSELETYLAEKTLSVYTEARDNYPQVYYNFNRRPIAITGDNYPHLHPLVSGRYISWQGVVNGLSQIFLYDVLTDTRLQLSHSGVNEGHFIKDNKVVWQRWEGRRWQIYYYDGFNVRRITDGNNSSLRGSTDGRQIIYAEQLDTDRWKAQSYDIASGKVATIREGDTASTAYPQFNADGRISTAFVPQ